MSYQSARGRHAGSLRLAGPAERPQPGQPHDVPDDPGAGSGPSTRDRDGIGARILQAWPLWPVLAAQAVLTLPWLWRTAPFTDEALYLEAGHKIWAHWLHHAALPGYASYFSGAPVLYPPLGAAADSADGVAAARGLSLLLMLAATALVYLAGSRLFGQQAAFFASALFGVLGLVVHYGAFATYDALALFFLTLSTWAAVRSRDGGYRWLAACAVALILSNAAKYATLAWDPVVAGVAVLHTWETGAGRALRRGSALAAGAAALAIGLLALGGATYVRGVSVTTVFRTIHFGPAGSASAVLWRAFALTAVLVLPAVAGVALSAARRNPLPVTGLLALLVLAALIAPIDQARIHELTSLDKNMGFGLPFAALAAGYAISAGIAWAGDQRPRGKVAVSMLAAALILLTLVAGREQGVQFRGPSRAATTQLVSAIRHGYQPGTYILSDGAARTEQYYLPSIPATAWAAIFDPAAAQRAQFRQRICAGQVSLVLLRQDHGAYGHPYDYEVRQLLQGSNRYKLAAIAGAGHYATQVWQLTSPAARGSCR